MEPFHITKITEGDYSVSYYDQTQYIQGCHYRTIEDAEADLPAVSWRKPEAGEGFPKATERVGR